MVNRDYGRNEGRFQRKVNILKEGGISDLEFLMGKIVFQEFLPHGGPLPNYEEGRVGTEVGVEAQFL